MKHLFGKIATIVANTTSHNFSIGQQVRLCDPKEDDYNWEDAEILGYDGDDYWELKPEDFSLDVMIISKSDLEALLNAGAEANNHDDAEKAFEIIDTALRTFINKYRP